MKIFYFIFFFVFCINSTKSQTITVSGECITGSIVINPTSNVDGKTAYDGTGTVDGIGGVQVSIYWMASDNLWVLAFSGQPYFQNSCNTALPPATDNSACTWATVGGQTCSGANPLIISGAGALPVELTSFTARIDNNQVILNWKTASESNNKGFEIERSHDAINWNNIGFVKGNINSSVERNYQFNDLKPISGKNFYRLRQVDLDDKFRYSIVASVTVLKSGVYSIYGNPGKGIYKVSIGATIEKIELYVIDDDGRKVMTKATGAGLQTIDISKFPPGIYFLRIRNGNSLFTEKLIKF